jgi:hypothetical protein
MSRFIINIMQETMIRQYGVTHLVFQLNNTETPMDGIINIGMDRKLHEQESVAGGSTSIISIGSISSIE